MRHATTSVETVVVPLTMLSDHPERLIQAFLAEKAQRLPLMAALHQTKDYANRLSTWGCMRYIKSQYRDRIGQWQETLLKYADPMKPNANRAKLPSIPLKLTQRFLPRMYTYGEVALSNGYTNNTLIGRRIARHWGMMSIKLQDDVDNTLLAYGPRVGSDRDAICFEAGLVDVWTARQFVDIFGVDALNTGHWLIPKENAFTWTEKPLEYGGFPDYLQMKTLLALDAIIRECKN